MFKIITKGGAIIEHQLHKEIAPISARRTFEENIQAEKAKVENTWYRGRVDTSEARKNLSKYTSEYERTCPETLSTQAREIMLRRAKQLKDEFSVGMLSRDELHPVKGFKFEGVMKWVIDEERMNVTRAVERNSAWEKANTQNIAEYKNIMRHLYPEDRGASDIERFRPRRGGG